MATWQTDYFILPQAKLIELYGSIQASVDEAELNNRLWWEGVPAPDRQEIERILPPLPNEINGRESWGAFQGNKFTLGYDKNGSLTDVQLRIDGSKTPQEVRSFVGQMVELANRSGWAFLPAISDSVLMPEFDVLAKDLNLQDVTQ